MCIILRIYQSGEDKSGAMGGDDAAMAFERIGLSPSFVQYVTDDGECFVSLSQIFFVLSK